MSRGRTVRDRKRETRLPQSDVVARALALLERTRHPLFREMRLLAEQKGYRNAEPEHHCCTRSKNRMRVSTLEAIAIVQALHRIPELRVKLPEIRARIQEERRHLRDSERLQNYECPLLSGTRCMVHGFAKPIACLAWNPGTDISETGWKALGNRDRLNDRAIGKSWELKAIPLLLSKYLDGAGGSAGRAPIRGSRRVRRGVSMPPASAAIS